MTSLGPFSNATHRLKKMNFEIGVDVPETSDG